MELDNRVEVYCTKLDQSTNAFDRYYVTRGDKVVHIWPIMGRGCAKGAVNALVDPWRPNMSRIERLRIARVALLASVW
jgi:hypothetical protein